MYQGGGGVFSLIDNDGGAQIGDDPSNDFHRMVPEFSISVLPATLVSIDTAKLSIDFNGPPSGGIAGSPFSTLGTLNVVHIFDATLASDTLDVAPLSNVGTIMSSPNGATGTKSIDVTAAVGNDFAERVVRGSRSQYRLQMSTKTDNDAAWDAVNVTAFSMLTLDVTYLIP
jgi:hypothetical protein